VGLVTAEAGIGKSRPLAELRASRADAIASGRVRWLQAGTDRLGAAADDLVALVQARTSGNPFFAEEILSAMVTSGSIEAIGGTWTLRHQTVDVIVPETVPRVDSIGLRPQSSKVDRELGC